VPRDLPFLLFTIAHEHSDSGGMLGQLKGQGHAGACRKSLPQVARIPFHSRDTVLHMTGKSRSKLTEFQEDVLFLDIPELGQYAVDSGLI